MGVHGEWVERYAQTKMKLEGNSHLSKGPCESTSMALTSLCRGALLGAEL